MPEPLERGDHVGTGGKSAGLASALNDHQPGFATGKS
jgi:hypothetical protein